METKHTPGPWAYHNTPTPFIHVAAGGLPICQIYTSTAHGQSMGEQFANARLIAAAPELLEALQAVLRSFPTDRDMRDAGWERAEIDLACRDYEAARAAISKALPNAAAKEAGK